MKNLSMTMTPKKTAGIIFLLSAVVRLILDINYFSRYGWHTTPGVEIFYYYGVANDIWPLSHYDITYWILRLPKFFFHDEALFHAVLGLGLLISSTTAVLVYLLARRILNEKGGFMAALIYSFMSQPLVMGGLFFTHDSIQMPIFILFLYAGLKLEEKRNILWGSMLILLFLLGLNVNPVIFLAIEILALYCIYVLASRIWGEKMFFIISEGFFLVLVLIIFLNITGVSERIIIMVIEIISRISSFTSEYLIETIKAGSADFIPITVYALWRRYNILFFFVPFGMVSLSRKRNKFVISLLLVSFAAALLFDRATRILDIGFALIATQALIFWEKGWNKYIPHVLIATLLFALFIAITGYFSVLSYLPYLAVFSFAYLLWKSHPQYTTIILCIFIAIQIYDLGFLPPPPLVCETEYKAYRFIGTQKGERVLTVWDHGFAAQAVSGKMASCSPQNFDNTYQIVLMKTSEEEALKIIEKDGMNFIVVDTSQFRLEPGGIHVSMFFKEYAPKDEEMTKTLLFRMLYKEDSLKFFKKIFEMRDKSTGIVVKVFIPIVRFK